MEDSYIAVENGISLIGMVSLSEYTEEEQKLFIRKANVLVKQMKKMIERVNGE